MGHSGNMGQSGTEIYGQRLKVVHLFWAGAKGVRNGVKVQMVGWVRNCHPQRLWVNADGSGTPYGTPGGCGDPAALRRR